MSKIEKELKKIIVFTSEFKIEGDMHVHPGARFSDYIETLAKKFIPITDARISIIGDDRCICETSFLELNKNEVIIILPQEELKV